MSYDVLESTNFQAEERYLIPQTGSAAPDTFAEVSELAKSCIFISYDRRCFLV